jgi:hypothetical protein
MEIWKTIPNFQNYQVSNYGRVWSNKTNKVLTKIICANGYQKVNLYKNKTVFQRYVHRLVVSSFYDTDDFENKEVDHINHKTTDNRLSNLRICTSQQNSYNRQISKNNTSGYRGVSYNKIRKTRPWQASIYMYGKRKHLGFFTTKEEASQAYEEKAKEIHGEFYYQADE